MEYLQKKHFSKFNKWFKDTKHIFNTISKEKWFSYSNHKVLKISHSDSEVIRDSIIVLCPFSKYSDYLSDSPEDFSENLRSVVTEHKDLRAYVNESFTDNWCLSHESEDVYKMA